MQNCLKGPLTTQQEVGWHALKAAPPQYFKYSKHTDVTIREGRDLKFFYGSV